MAVSLRQLKKDIAEYIAAHPDQWDDVVDIARNSGPPTEPLPEGHLVLKDAVEWYQRIREEGKDFIVLSGDDTAGRLIGFHIISAHGSERGIYYLPLHIWKTQKDQFPESVQQKMSHPGGRAKLGELFGKGRAPKVQGSSAPQ